MQSLEAKFAEALASLKKASATKYDKVFDECQKLTTLEAKISCVEAALGNVKESKPSGKDFSSRNDANIEALDEAKRDFAILFDVAPRQATTTNNESKAPIKKHNGAAETFTEANPFNEGRSTSATPITETSTRKNIYARADRIIHEASLKAGEITQDQFYKLTTGRPSGYEKLTEKAKKEFDRAVMFGFNESDAFKLAALAVR